MKKMKMINEKRSNWQQLEIGVQVIIIPVNMITLHWHSDCDSLNISVCASWIVWASGWAAP